MEIIQRARVSNCGKAQRCNCVSWEQCLGLLLRAHSEMLLGDVPQGALRVHKYSVPVAVGIHPIGWDDGNEVNTN